ncbi:hypothetical protein [Methyloglobulus sp.]|uniref:hypothetical protein n=1 Tax=Methyloglobulus sp. TaxID=2518622 RepID=UPI00398A19A7
MKLILQIAFGAFLGAFASQFTFDAWRSHQEGIAKAAEEKLQAEQEKVRLEQGERIRALLMQGRQGNTPNASKPPAGFVPDDARGP